mmetsp:Transcript_7647/g.8785  ORF Transcript_7647/g.8785 Transcript_7647/m.8785 type:complete len:186 (-) Transcript_7647:324-881(-)
MLLAPVHRLSVSLKKFPVLVKTAIGGTTALAGECTAQSLSNNSEIDWKRANAFTLFGAWWSGPFSHFYLGALEKRFPLATGVRAVIPKVLITTFLATPIVYIPVYLATICSASSMDYEESKQFCCENYVSTFVSCSLFWLPINGAVYRLVPEHVQAISLAFIGLIWNTILSYRTRRNCGEPKELS